MRLGRGALIVAGAVAVVSSLSSCSVMYNGAVAVTKGADGTVMILVQTCDRQLDELTLYGNPSETTWVADPAAAEATLTTVPVTGSQPPWTLTSDAPELGPRGRYNLNAVGRGNWLNGMVRAWTVYFTAADVDRLEPGQVIAGVEGKTMTLEAFQESACRKG
jgi:hypothetical protein